MKTASGLLLLLFLSATPALTQQNAEALALLRRAADSIDIANAGMNALALEMEFSSYGLREGDENGTYRAVWLASGSGRADVTAGAYSETVWWAGQRAWRQAAGYSPVRVSQFEKILNLRELLLNALRQENFKTHTKKIDGTKLKCALAESPPDFSLDACVDPVAGRPSYVETGGIEYEFPSYAQLGDKLFPSGFKVSERGNRILTGTLTRLERSVMPSPDFFQPPPGVVPIAGPRCGDAQLAKKTVPDYPAIARSNRTQGTVTFGASLSPDGKVSDLQVLQSAGPILDNAALAAVTKWQYKPLVCDGVPTAAQIDITVNFSLSQ